ncbi:MAG: TorF family putative porin [Gammaproteobacteria bacterium]
MSIHKKLTCALVLAHLSAAAMAADEAAPSWTGHVDVVSKYVLRGITSTYGPGEPLGNANADAPESKKAALQWGADWTHPSGFYLGYFGSTVNYSYKALGESYANRSVTAFQHDKSIENDLYGGYTGKAGDISYTAGLTGYVYINGKHANAFETKFSAGYGPFVASAQTLLDDVVWGNKGDTYWTLNYSAPLPYQLNFTASLGYYTYKKEGKFLGSVDTFTGVACPANQGFFTNGCLPSHGPVSGGFRHLIVGITQPIASTGVTWGLQGILGGDNRFGVKQKNQLVATLSYGF